MMTPFLFVLIALTNAADRTVVATVDGLPVHAAEVEAELRQAYGERQLANDEQQRLFKAALEQVIDRQLVLRALAKSGEAASPDDVAVALAKFEKELAAQSLTLAQHCEKVGLTPDDVRRAVAWKLSWKRYCEKHLTPQNLEKFFARNHREFDGTQLRVAQILIAAQNANYAAALEQAGTIRGQIVAGQTTFAEAAQRHSTAPSRATGGDIGWIERHKPMPEAFSVIAFALKTGEVSEPFTSPYGVHLVTVLEEKKGTRTWQDVENQLRPAVVVYLFRWLADRERASANIVYLPPAN